MTLPHTGVPQLSLKIGLLKFPEDKGVIKWCPLINQRIDVQ